MRSIRVRFNLGKGPNFMKWKIQYPDGRVEYKDPDKTQLILDGCVLKNHQGVAKRIFEGENKRVCAWVLCKNIEFRNKKFISKTDDRQRVKYNPKQLPFWIYRGDIVDGQSFERLYSYEKALYAW